MLHNEREEIFACSRASYLDRFGGQTESRIYIAVRFDTLPKTFAIVDTAAPWCIINEEQAEELNPNYKDEALEERCLTIRGEKANGVLIRLPITIYADDGEDITIEGTVFIPRDDREIPNFVGLDGFLNRIKFAVDPQERHFFFGPIQE